MNDLPDIQQSTDTRGIPLQQVGVCGVKVPMQICDSKTCQQVAVDCDIAVDLPAETKGTSMSRLVVLLSERAKSKYTIQDGVAFVQELAQAAGTETAQLSLGGEWFLEKPSPVSDYSAPQAYGLTLRYRQQGEQIITELGLHIVASNCCPCSKAIADGGAHNQRVNIIADMTIASEDLAAIDLQQLIFSLEDGASCPMHPILKRPDEKWVTERQYNNPKFVEDVARDVITTLQANQMITAWHLRVEAEESIHTHNAFVEASG